MVPRHNCFLGLQLSRFGDKLLVEFEGFVHKTRLTPVLKGLYLTQGNTTNQPSFIIDHHSYRKEKGIYFSIFYYLTLLKPQSRLGRNN